MVVETYSDGLSPRFTIVRVNRSSDSVQEVVKLEVYGLRTQAESQQRFKLFPNFLTEHNR